jgi:hypothetical protein
MFGHSPGRLKGSKTTLRDRADESLIDGLLRLNARCLMFKNTVMIDPPAPLHEIVSRQYSEIENAHDRIKNLRDTAKTS